MQVRNALLNYAKLTFNGLTERKFGGGAGLYKKIPSNSTMRKQFHIKLEKIIITTFICPLLSTSKSCSLRFSILTIRIYRSIKFLSGQSFQSQCFSVLFKKKTSFLRISGWLSLITNWLAFSTRAIFKMKFC